MSIVVQASRLQTISVNEAAHPVRLEVTMKPLVLIDNIRQGRDVNQSQKELYDLVREALLERLRRKIPPRLRSRLDAEDVVQAAFLKAMDALDGFQPQGESSFFAWVYRIAVNRIADQGKRRSVAAIHFTHGEDQGGVRQSQVSTRQGRPESHMQRRDWIESVLSQLKEKEAEVIRLRWLEGQSFEDIATSWKKNAGAVQRFHSRAWQRFCAIAEQEQADEDEN